MDSSQFELDVCNFVADFPLVDLSLGAFFSGFNFLAGVAFDLDALAIFFFLGALLFIDALSG